MIFAHCIGLSEPLYENKYCQEKESPALRMDNNNNNLHSKHKINRVPETRICMAIFGTFGCFGDFFNFYHYYVEHWKKTPVIFKLLVL